MAKYTITYLTKNVVAYELKFMGENFDYLVRPGEKRTYWNDLEYGARLKKAFPKLSDGVLKLLDAMVCCPNHAATAIDALTAFELKHDWVDDD